VAEADVNLSVPHPAWAFLSFFFPFFDTKHLRSALHSVSHPRGFFLSSSVDFYLLAPLKPFPVRDFSRFFPPSLYSRGGAGNTWGLGLDNHALSLDGLSLSSLKFTLYIPSLFFNLVRNRFPLIIFLKNLFLFILSCPQNCYGFGRASQDLFRFLRLCFLRLTQLRSSVRSSF